MAEETNPSVDPKAAQPQAEHHEEPHSDFEDHMPHKPADDKEETYFDGSPMLRGELESLFACTLGGLILIAVPILLSRKWALPWWLWVAMIVLGVCVAMIPHIMVRSVRYRITNYRIDWERGVFSKTIDTLELWHVEDIKFYQSLWDRILKVGDVTIISHDESTPELKLRSIPNPRPLYETLKQRVIAVKRQRGVVKMDIGG